MKLAIMFTLILAFTASAFEFTGKVVGRRTVQGS
jgi:hypothetical protein